MRRMVCGFPEDHVEQGPQRSLQPLELEWKYEYSVGSGGRPAPRQHSELGAEKNLVGEVKGFVHPRGTEGAVQCMGIRPTEQIVRDAGVLAVLPVVVLGAPSDGILEEAARIK